MAFTDKPCENVNLFEFEPGLWLASATLFAACEQAPAWALSLADKNSWQPGRRQAFLAGRAMAGAALEALGCDDPVAIGCDAAPHWPEGIVGSISHNADQAVAVVAFCGQTLALGVDVETDAPLPVDAAESVLLPEDIAALTMAFGPRATQHTRLVFGAKECVHKALNPLCGVWLDFDEVCIEWLDTNENAGQWQATAISAKAVSAFAGATLRGRWWRTEGTLWTLLHLLKPL